MGPRIRFLLVIFILSTATWAYLLISEYFIGPRGLNLTRYLHGAFIVGLSVLAGYTLVWLSVRFMNFRDSRKTGFEALLTDESGTTFNMHVSLNKFLPEIIAPPSGDHISPLESELLGFLNSLGDWPFSLEQKGPTLREYSLQLWSIMSTLPHAGPLHRAAALSANLSKVYAYQEKRKSAPLSHFWTRDKVSYSRRCQDHGGMSSFILSQMPAFRELGDGDARRNQTERRALLTAIRYHREPLNLPQNCDSLAREICDYLNRAQIQLDAINTGIPVHRTPTQEDIQQLQNTLEALLPGTLQDLDFSPENLAHKRHGFYQRPPFLTVSTYHLASLLSQSLQPALRSTFQLWETQEAYKTLMPYLTTMLREKGWLIEAWEDDKAHHGMFSFTVGDTALPRCYLLNVSDPLFASIRRQLSKYPPLQETVELHYDLEQRIGTIKHKAQSIDEQLSTIFPRHA